MHAVLPIQRLFVLALVVLACTSASAQRPARSLIWQLVEPLKPGVVSVVIDTTDIQKDDVLDQASLNVAFIDASGTNLGTERYELLKRGEAIPAGTVVQFDIPHSYAQAKSVAPSSMTWHSHLLGGKSDDPNAPDYATQQGKTHPVRSVRQVD